ncbi:MAG: alpha/beta hydrolase [Chloroflexi bacterium]|nr:alpha/beta hydrolase [Chloroflexota bacterium]
MSTSESTLTAFDGTSLFVRKWTPSTEPQALLVIVHGLGEHAGRYPHVVTAFNQQGYVVWGDDHRGFGRSGGKRGDFNAFSDVLTDLDQVVDAAQAQYPHLPIFLYAHSLGGMYATHYLAQHEDKITAAVISAPGYGAGPDFSQAKLLLARVLAKVAPGLSMQTAGADDPFTLSHDPEAEQSYRDDKLYHHTVTMRFAYTNVCKANEAKNLLAHLHLPILVLLGAEDSTINRDAVEEAVAGAGKNVEFRIYPGSYHELHNEIPAIRQRVLAETLAWLQPLITQSAASPRT